MNLTRRGLLGGLLSLIAVKRTPKLVANTFGIDAVTYAGWSGNAYSTAGVLTVEMIERALEAVRRQCEASFIYGQRGYGP